MTAKTNTGVCALCHLEKVLLESHIASKFLWKRSGVTGKNKKFSLLSHTHPELRALPKTRFSSFGFYGG
jgi:hypothetical protein